MIKRVNKVIGIIMLIAFVTPMTPVMAANVTPQELETQEGKINNAVVFKDGKYIYDGYKGDNSTGVYFNDGSSEKELDDVEELDYTNHVAGNSKYGDKYALALDNDDEYMVDLSDGKVISDDNPDDLLSSAENKLKAKLRRASRYGDDFEIETFKKIAPGMLEDTGTWYEYTAKTTTSGAAEVTYFGYADAKGNYIDCSKKANFEIWDGEHNVEVEEFDDTITKYDKTFKVGLPTVEHTLGQDTDYIYNVIEVPVTGYHKFNNDNYSDDQEVKLKFVQKISKAKGEKEDGAFLPKEENSYQLNGDIGYSDVGDGEKWKYYAASAFLGHFDPSMMQVRISGGFIMLATTCPDPMIQNDKKNPEVALAAIRLNEHVKLKRESDDEKKDLRKIAGAVTIYFSEAELDTNATKIPGYLTKPTSAWAMDKDGTVWSVFKGKIKRYFMWDEFYTVYKCDRTINHIDVYEDNIIAWSDDSDIYVTAKKDTELAAATGAAKASTAEAGTEVAGTNGTAVTETTTSSAVTISNQTGWQKSQNSWYFYDAKGNALKGWIKDGPAWYYLDDNGIMKTGWIYDNQKWYYLDVSGAMTTGWVKAQDGKWYYLNPLGAMEFNTTVDGYILGTDGAWVQ